MFASKDALIANAGGGYPINNSLRFRSSASAYLNRTFGAGSQTSWTWSAWIKRGTLGAFQVILSAPISSGSTEEYLAFSATDTLYHRDGSGAGTLSETVAVFRDPSAWYHVVYVYDSANATQSLRGVWYINGVQQTNSTNAIGASRASYINRALSTAIGRFATIASSYIDTYFAEINFIGGSSLGPTNFGAYSATTGVWQPALYTGSYGTNGFYLKFASFGTAAALGNDSSGNGNTWTVNNISIATGTTYDPMLDSPTLTSATVANYATLNPLGGSTPSVAAVLSNANLTAVYNRSTNNSWTPATTAIPSSGKWYWEWVQTTDTTTGLPYGFCGVLNVTSNRSTQDPSAWRMITGASGNKASNAGGIVAYGSAGALNDIFGVAVDMDNGKIFFSKNGTWQGSGDPVAGTNAAYTDLVSSGITWVPGFWFAGDLTGTVSINFGQRAFSGVPANSGNPPTGFVALNAYNLPTPTIANGATVMAATTYAGNSSTNNILNSNNTTTAVSFKPDFVWVKSRTTSLNPYLSNSLTGVYQVLFSPLNSQEYNGTSFSDGVSAFNSNGFTLLNGTNVVNYNATGTNYIAWQWQAGQGTTTNIAVGQYGGGLPSIASTVSVNTAAGFSIVTYTGVSTNPGTTIAHGLNAVPAMIITKSRNAAGEWPSYHQSIPISNTIYLNANYASSTYLNRFGAVSSQTFTTGANGSELNASGTTYVAYCWAAVAGYSAFGSYTGNGAPDGPFVYTGFRPRLIMIKRTDTTANWRILDTSRDTYNVESAELYPNLALGETTFASLDGLSNGFKIRNTDASYNATGGTYIYAAFAENPFNYALAR